MSAPRGRGGWNQHFRASVAKREPTKPAPAGLGLRVLRRENPGLPRRALDGTLAKEAAGALRTPARRQGGTSRYVLQVPLDLELLVMAYANGVFPMSDARDDPETFWIEPERRAIIPLEGLKLSASLKKVIRQDRFTRRVSL